MVHRGGHRFQDHEPFIYVVTALTLFTASIVAEIVREHPVIAPGQVEAAISLGLNPFQRLRLVYCPKPSGAWCRC